MSYVDYTHVKDQKHKDLFSNASLDSNLKDFLTFFQNNINKLIKISEKDKFHICVIYPKGIILNKHNIDNQAVTYHFSFIFNGDEYSTQRFDEKILQNSEVRY